MTTLCNPIYTETITYATEQAIQARPCDTGKYRLYSKTYVERPLKIDKTKV